MLNGIRPRLQSIAYPLLPLGVGSHSAPRPVGCAADCFHLLQRQLGRSGLRPLGQNAAGGHQLHQIGIILDLLPGRLQARVTTVTLHTHEVTVSSRHRDKPPGGIYIRPLYPARPYQITQLQINAVQSPHVPNGGHPRRQKLSQLLHGNDSPLRRLIGEHLVSPGHRDAANMRMAIDHSRGYGIGGPVDDPITAHRHLISKTNDPPVLYGQVVKGRRPLRCAVDDLPTDDNAFHGPSCPIS